MELRSAGLSSAALTLPQLPNTLTIQVYGRLVSPAHKSLSAGTAGAERSARPGHFGSRQDNSPGWAQYLPTRGFCPESFHPSLLCTLTDKQKCAEGEVASNPPQPRLLAIVFQRSENARAQQISSCAWVTLSSSRLKCHSQGHRKL